MWQGLFAIAYVFHRHEAFIDLDGAAYSRCIVAEVKASGVYGLNGCASSMII